MTSLKSCSLNWLIRSTTQVLRPGAASIFMDIINFMRFVSFTTRIENPHSCLQSQFHSHILNLILACRAPIIFPYPIPISPILRNPSLQISSPLHVIFVQLNFYEGYYYFRQERKTAHIFFMILAR